MFKNYLTIAIRNIARHKVYSFINIIGLSVGIACCGLIGLYIHTEISVDQFHRNGDRIYRLVRETNIGGKRDVSINTSGGFALALKNDFPEVKQTTRFMSHFWTNLQYGDQFLAHSVAVVDPSFFDLFDFTFTQSNVENIKAQPRSVVVSEKFARRLFGNEDPLGKVVNVRSSLYFIGDVVIRGVIESVAEKSSFPCDFIIVGPTNQVLQREEQWEGWRPTGTWPWIVNYVMLKPGQNAQALESKLNEAVAQYMGDEVAQTHTYHLQPFKRMYLYSQVDYGQAIIKAGQDHGWRSGHIQDVYIIGSVACFILLIACINFVNLSTARSARRAQEVGLRKVVGAQRMQVMGQFFGEAFLMVILSTVMALGLMELSLPFFSNHVLKPDSTFGVVLRPGLSFEALNFWQAVVGVLGLASVVSVLSGFYPAVLLSGFQPVETLKGALRRGDRRGWMRKGLVVAQFSLSILLMVSTAIIYQQIEYIRSKHFGTEYQVLNTHFLWADRVMTPNPTEQLNKRYPTIKQALLQNPNVLDVTTAGWRPGSTDQAIQRPIIAEGREGEDLYLSYWRIGADFIPFYGLEMVAGHNFSEHSAVDGQRRFIINGSAARLLDWDDPIGKTIAWDKQAKGTVIGVVKDYHFYKLNKKIQPMLFFESQGNTNMLFIKLRPEGLAKTVSDVKNILAQFSPEAAETGGYHWEDEVFTEAYLRETRLSTMVTTFSGLAILLACLGLFGLASYAAEVRTKEIGIRKVLGASVSGVVMMLSKDFVKWVIVASLIAWPVAYYAANRWLAEFAYRIDVSVWPFVLGALLALGIALGTVSYQAFKAARANPVDSLRYE